jgi:hypothetical protein
MYRAVLDGLNNTVNLSAFFSAVMADPDHKLPSYDVSPPMVAHTHTHIDECVAASSAGIWGFLCTVHAWTKYTSTVHRQTTHMVLCIAQARAIHTQCMSV